MKHENSSRSAADPGRDVKRQEPSFQHQSTAILLQRAYSAPSTLRASDVLRLQRTIGNRATIRLLSNTINAQAKPKDELPIDDVPSKTHQQISPVGAPRIQARLMDIDTFKRDKAAATTKKSFGPLIKLERSTADVEKIYKSYHAFVNKRQYANARQELTKLDLKLTRMEQKGYWRDNQERDSLINRMRAGLQSERQWLTHEEGAQTGAEQTLGRNIGGGITPQANRPKASLTMGQGLTADLGQMILFSDEFSSCSPIVMFNANNRIGGLFHFPAGSLEEQSGNLRNMYNRVQPTEIHLNDRNINNGYSAMGQSNDLALLQNFFTHECNFGGNLQVIAMKGNQYAVTLDNNGGVEIAGDIHTTGGGLSATHDRTGDERVAMDQAWQNAPATSKFGRDDWHSL